MAENKSPAFQFYAENFLSGTADMTAEEVGAYIRLLCHQWHKGGIPNDEKKLMVLTGTKAKIISEVKNKFELCEDGFLRNERLEKSRLQQEEYRNRQKINGNKGGRPKKHENVETQTEPKQNPVVIENITQTKPLQSSSSSSSSSSLNNSLTLPHEKVVEQTLGDEIFCEQAAMAVGAELVTFKEFVSGRLSEMKITGQSSKYPLGTVRNILIQDYKFKKEQTKRFPKQETSSKVEKLLTVNENVKKRFENVSED